VRILCTGDAGFIGSHVRQAFGLLGHDTLGADIKRGECLDVAKLTAEQLGNVDVIVHHAAQSSQADCIADPIVAIYHNIIGTCNLLRVAKEIGVRHFVFASTSCVYADVGEFTESTPLHPRGVYGITKLAAEYFVRNSTIPYTIFRYANVYGVGQLQVGENQIIPHCLAHLVNGKPFAIHGTGEKRRDFIYVDDVVAANVAAVERRIFGIFNIGTEVSHSINEVCSTLAALCDKPHHKFAHDEDRVGEAQMTKLISLKFRNAAHWQPRVMLSDGLALTAEWWKKTYGKKER